MAFYRLYQLRISTDEIESVQEFEVDGDSIAIALAEGWRNLNPMELWRDQRKVRRWEALIVPAGSHKQCGIWL